MSHFVAIDFETATYLPHSICQVGLVVVEDCKIVDRIGMLIKPPGNDYTTANIKVHGITPDKTKDALPFNEAWVQLEKYIANKNAVAHNASFDMNCLMKTLFFYGLPYPKINWHCTYKIYKSKLSVACASNGIKIEKAHDAISDAEACALLMIKDIKRK